MKDADGKIMAYKKAAEKFNDDRAINNLTATYLDNGKVAEAKAALAKINNKDTYYYNNAGVIALRDKNYKAAVENFAKSDLKVAKYNSAIVDILNGRYNEAVSKLAGSGDENEGLAFILTNQLDKAAAAIKCKCPHAAYQRAIIAARKGNAAEVDAQLAIVAKSKSLNERAQNDIEFAKYRK